MLVSGLFFGKIPLRLSDWWNSKIPPLLAFAYLFIALSGLEFLRAMFQLLLFIIWAIGAAGFGHYVNDCFDIKADELAGKSNIASGQSTTQKWLISLALSVIAILPWFFRPFTSVVLPLVILHLFLFVVYSAPGTRLKERGYLGILTDSLYAHVIPTLIVITAFGIAQFSPNKSSLFSAGIVLVWSFLYGLRGILSHQIGDYENDTHSGSITFVRQFGKEKAAWLISFLALFECITFLFIWYLIRGGFLYMSFCFLVFIFYKLTLVKLIWKINLNERFRIPLYNSLFSNFYEQWFPILILVKLSYNHPVFIILLIMHLIFFQETIIKLAQEVKSIASIFK